MTDLTLDFIKERNDLLEKIERLREQAHYHYENGLKKDVEIEWLREALKELLNVIPNFPSDGNFLVGMKARYNQALIEARAALKEGE